VSFTSTSLISYCRGTPEYTWYFGDGGTSFLQSPTHTYTNGGTYVWSLTVRESGGTCTQTGTVVINNPPVVTQMKAKDQPEFNIIAKGRNLQPGVAVYINGVQWYSTTWKSTSKIRLNGGTALKAVAPPNIPLQFTFVNPDGASWTVIWQYPL
jgi:PKD repeat protein